MPLDKTVRKVLVIGSGPIVIGQAAEFDYAGTQACRALREDGIEIVLLNSNPATIMTDKSMADKIYIEPLTLTTVKRIIETERPDSILSGLGGQTALTLCMQLAKEGFLESHGVKLLGSSPECIDKAEDRQMFKDTMEAIGQPCIPSKVVTTVEDAMDFAKESYEVFQLFNDRWALATAGSMENYNTMTIGWGSMGTLWGPPHKGKPVLTIYVSPARYTHTFLEQNDYFTVSFFPEEYRKDLALLGSRSGRDGDKVALTALTLTLAAPESGPAQYHFDFRSGDPALTLTIPASVTMPDGWGVEAGKRYEIDILDGYGLAQSWAQGVSA